LSPGLINRMTGTRIIGIKDAYSLVWNYAEPGDNDRAFAWMNKAAELRSTMLFWVYIYQPQPLPDPGFDEVKRKLSAHHIDASGAKALRSR
jgi:hypothetical protein